MARRRQRRSKVSAGIIRVTRKGYGFVDTPDGEYFVLRGYLRGAMDGDRVEVARLHALEKRRRQRMRKTSAQHLHFSDGGHEHEMLGSVRGILERAHETLVGVVRYADGLGVVHPFDEHIPYDVFLDHRAPEGIYAAEGSVVVVRLTTYPGRIEAAQGFIEEIIGREDDEGMDIEIIVRGHGFETAFSPAATEEAQQLVQTHMPPRRQKEAGQADLDVEPFDVERFGAEPHAVGVERPTAKYPGAGAEHPVAEPLDANLARRDLRDRFVFTIDPEDAKDFDDALSLDFVDGKMVLGVHIADVSSYVLWNSALDLDARRRSTSVYLPDRVIPMLPSPLSDGLCSLRPNEDRRAFSLDMTMASDGSVEKCAFFPSLIRSSARLNYDEAQRILDDKEQGQREGHWEAHREAQQEAHQKELLVDKLSALHKLAQKLTRRRVARGAIEFEGVEAKLVLDDSGMPLAVRLRGRTDATALVEEAMILANEQVASFMLAHGAPMVYRIHDEPSAAALDELLPTLREFGYATQQAPQTSRDIQAILEASEGKPEHHLVSTLLLRAMKRAKYAPVYTMHFGLASTGYTHFTSPIRRYPDLMVHRLLKCQLAAAPAPDDMLRQLSWICEHSSDGEREAEHAFREATAIKLCLYLEPRIGERFSAVITSLNTAGLVAREDTTTAEGFIKRESLSGDFEYERKHHRYVDPTTGESYRLGQPVHVTLTAINHTQARPQFVITP
ncbi:MAG: VacB/RNase II family 3'-5' exoribonuclease, partial [Coriobacteriales bacterium]|nr:VacB/RNase II family 3'-5' exoribonuclease [Coriobacteriales bacterium]